MRSAAFWRAWSIWAVYLAVIATSLGYDAVHPLPAQFAARLKDAVDLDTVRSDLTCVVQVALEPARLWVWTSERD